MQASALFKTFSAGALAFALAACGGQKETAPAAASAASQPAAAGAEKQEIVFGTTVGDFGDMVKEQIQPALEKKGYKVKLIEFTDYVRPNLALAEGELDINIFQHKPYLDDFKKEHKLDITEVFQVPTAPLGLYPGKLKSLDEVKDGSSVSAPNDPSNFARALVMLNELGWIKLKDGINPLTASKNDIAENLKNINIVELEAAQLPRSRADVDFAIVNGNYAMSSGMKLTETLFQEPSFAYVNWSAVKTADKDSQWVKDVTDAYNSDEFKTYAKQRFAGYKYPASWGEQAAAGAKAEAASTASAAK
ncbi:MetQ/NlpA family ABC transporter substrate-binding protein [Neisseria dentiae]|uniref:MetQ/NlpA family ABC transporter substrate-binding protein n=1 Tax=Neisseria dentiae TaxID=194197 RepID=UPI00211CDF5F|nr:MetQ/NlpA family ABC transporter substrate-binding protein [Neisseria dentiae]MCQ9326540.1 MetQ/NlpA family ABC transporter substrate-binding protein [Neisseria dentiae]